MLTLTDKGLFCEPGRFYIDPCRGVDRAVITHAHSDHACGGSRKYLAHSLTAPVLTHRLGRNLSVQPLEYGERIEFNGVTLSFHPAGHIPGSAQVRVEYRGEVWVVSGDYKLESDGISTPFEPVRCDTFISECTFGLPIFRWKPQREVFNEIDLWWRENRELGRTSVITCYSLGKAQRILANVSPDLGEIYGDGSIVYTTDALRRAGMNFPSLRKVRSETDSKWYRGALVLAPPSAVGSPWLQKLGPLSVANASGWMAIRKLREQRGADRNFVLSDHADFPGLLCAIRGSGASRVLLTHGYTASFARYLSESGIKAEELKSASFGEVDE